MRHAEAADGKQAARETANVGCALQPGAGGSQQQRTMTDLADVGMSPHQRRELFLLVLVRVLAQATVMVALYYVAPLDRLGSLPIGVTLATAALILAGTSVWQIRAILDSSRPTVRAIEAFSAWVPLYLLMFASGYYVLARDDLANFSSHVLTRTDSLYYTVTVFTTVGFGDITATSQTARLIVTLQMILNLVVLGLGVRLITGAVRVSKARHPHDTPSA